MEDMERAGAGEGRMEGGNKKTAVRKKEFWKHALYVGHAFSLDDS